jgi:RND superfamily putative drug exporter
VFTVSSTTPRSFTGRLAGSAAAHPWRYITVWLLILVMAGFFAAHIGDALSDQGGLAVPTESSRADDLIAAHLDTGSEPAREFVIVESETVTADAAPFVSVVEQLARDLRASASVASVVSYLDGIPGMTSEDGSTALVIVALSGDPVDAMLNAEGVISAVEAADAEEGFRVTTFGEGSVNVEFEGISEETLVKGETYGLSIALVILVLVFGALVAAGIPLLLAVVSIVLAVGLTAVIGQAFALSFFVINMITMIGLAVGIDYTLFIVQRFREERFKGHPVCDAVARAGDSATRAVFFSGLTVVIALAALLYMPETVMRSMGVGAILAVVAALLAALTLLPAVLGLLGDKVNRLRVPFASRSHYREGGGRFWHGVTRVVTAHPLVSVVLAGGLLLALATQYLNIATGSNFIGSLPEDSNSLHAFEVVTEEFDAGAFTTPIVVSATDVGLLPIRDGIDEVVDYLAANPGFGETTVEVSQDGRLAVIEAVTKLDPASAAATAELETLRRSVIPAAFSDTQAEVLVTGVTAQDADYVEVLNDRTPIIFAFVLGLSFLLLMVVFRSIVVPLKAIILNLLSVGAAYGLLVLVFQQGIGADLLGFRTSDVIEAWVPLFLFAVLFGLSMDYHIFLLTRIKERYDVTGDNTASVAFGLGSTGSIITGAALIMVAVFGGFAAGDLVMFQQMGFGLGIAVILDATIVRTVLVPATMALLGERNWYLPRWLQWLPKINIEGRPDEVVGVEREPVLSLPAP